MWARESATVTYYNRQMHQKEELMETVILTRDKMTPGTTRFSADSDVVSNIYIKKPYFGDAKKIRITIEEFTEE